MVHSQLNEITSLNNEHHWGVKHIEEGANELNKKSLIILSIVGILFLIVAGFIGKAMTGNNKEDTSGYDTYEVKPESAIKVTGKVSPESIKTYQNNAQLGEFVSAQVNEGQRVTQGTPLIHYQIDGAKRNQLYEQVRHSETKGDQAAVNQAWKQLNDYDRQVNDSVYATFNGIVSNVKKSNVSEGEPILKLIAEEPQIKTTVSEFDLDKIAVGDTVNVTVTSSGKKGKGKIKSIAQLPTSYEDNHQGGGQALSGTESMPSAEEGQMMKASNPIEQDPSGGDDNASSKYSVMIGNLDFDVRHGFSIEAEIPLKTLKIPKTVLTKDDNVYVVDENHVVHKRKIKYDEKNGDLVIKEGLKQGDVLIKKPDNDIKDGKKVEVSS